MPNAPIPSRRTTGDCSIDLTVQPVMPLSSEETGDSARLLRPPLEIGSDDDHESVIRLEVEENKSTVDREIEDSHIGTSGHNKFLQGSSFSARKLLQKIRVRRPSLFKQPSRKFRVFCIVFSALLFLLAFALVPMVTHLKSSEPIQWSEDQDEPNPPELPDSMVLLQPPQNEQEADHLNKILEEYSDPKITLAEFRDKNPGSNVQFPEFSRTSAKHFSEQRTALLFAPGTYSNIDFEVGYYTSVIGLGENPDDVQFINCSKGPHVPALDKFTDRPPNGSGLNTFWRSVENFATNPVEGMRWVVSQAAPLRRLHVQTDLHLFDADSWVSGGVAANTVVDGKVNFGGQQQWVMRNVHLGQGAVGGAWNLVFVGCTGVVPKESGGAGSGNNDDVGPSITVENNPKLRVEKPYIVMKPRQPLIRDNRGTRKTSNQSDLAFFTEHSQYELELRVPKIILAKDAYGPNLYGKDFDVRDFRRVKLGIPITSNDSDFAAVENHAILQKALDQGKDLVLAPGIYHLSSSLEIKHPNQVILGLGYATLIGPSDGSPCIYIPPQIPGVRIAGVMLEASVLSVDKNTTSKKSTSLLQWGDPNIEDPGNETNPGCLFDVFARVGGASFELGVSTNVMVQLNSGNIYADNLWLWRADHVKLHPMEKANFPHISPLYRQTVKGECNANNGLIVNGANVTIVGLAVEHTIHDQTIWNGEDGNVYFYQCELPYDVDETFATKNYVGYRVGPDVKRHRAYGLGIYSNFRDFDVEVDTAVIHPEVSGVHLRNIFTVKLDNQGMIKTVVNNLGE
ncbi:hypothetical protein ACHAXS_004651 [Conticribra weissflogii]